MTTSRSENGGTDHDESRRFMNRTKAKEEEKGSPYYCNCAYIIASLNDLVKVHKFS